VPIAFSEVPAKQPAGAAVSPTAKPLKWRSRSAKPPAMNAWAGRYRFMEKHPPERAGAAHNL